MCHTEGVCGARIRATAALIEKMLAELNDATGEPERPVSDILSVSGRISPGP